MCGSALCWGWGIVELRVRAPDGGVVTASSPFEIPGSFNFLVMISTPEIYRAVTPFEVALGRTLSDFEDVAQHLPERINVRDIRITEFDGRSFATAEVRMEEYFGDIAVVRWAAWEGATGCIQTSLINASHDDMVALFEGTQFHEEFQAPGGIVFDSPIDNTESPQWGGAYVEGLGFLRVEPAIPQVLAKVPSRAGAAVVGGDLYRANSHSESLILVGEHAVTYLTPGDASSESAIAAMSEVSVEWV